MFYVKVDSLVLLQKLNSQGEDFEKILSVSSDMSESTADTCSCTASSLKWIASSSPIVRVGLVGAITGCTKQLFRKVNVTDW